MVVKRRWKVRLAAATAALVAAALIRQGMKAPTPVLSREDLNLFSSGDGGNVVEFSGMGKYKRRVKGNRKYKRKGKISVVRRGLRYGKKLAGMGVVAATLGAGGQFGRTMMKRYLY